MVISHKCSNFAVVIEIERHIEILLLDNDCVIVPGLGGFTAHHVEARYDESDDVFLPPLRTLGFNQQLKINDSLLVQSYVEAYDISYPEALRRIEGEVEELNQRIENDGYYEMTDIGVLEMNDDGNIVFTPCEAGILTPGLYGLSSFEMQPLREESPVATFSKDHEQKANPELSPITTTVFDSVLQKAETSEDTGGQDTDTNDDTEKTICIKVAWLRNAGIAAAAVILLLFVVFPISHSSLRNVNIGDFNGTSFFSKLMPKDSQMNKISISEINTSPKDISRQSAKDSVKDIVKDSIKIIQPKVKSDTFCIVLASCIPQKNAEKYVEQLHSKGLDKAYTMVNNRMVRVIYGNYASETDAYNDLQKIRSNDEFEQAWILKKKN